MTLTGVQRFSVSAEIIKGTEATLRAAGRDGYEMFVLWSGRREDDSFRFITAHAPRQTSYRTKEGLSVKIDGPELHRLNVWLLDNQETLAAQVHAHPSEAFHSHTDDTYPIVTALGGLSLVAADFARYGLLSDSSALYHLKDDGWEAVPLHEILEVV